MLVDVATKLQGSINIDDSVVRANIASAIRRPLPQVRPIDPRAQRHRIAIVGGGPSLVETLPELRDLVFSGAKVVALNGSAAWLVAQNIKPDVHVLLDGRPFNARFLEPAVPGCKYLIASQCAPETFDAAAGRDVSIWHSVSAEDEDLLQDWYGEKYISVGGGTTVMCRAIVLLRLCGFLRMDLFGFDSCFGADGTHHAYPQAENDDDRPVRVQLVPTDHRTGEKRWDLARPFRCAPWHMKQVEDFQLLVKEMGNSFSLAVHGDGLIATMMRLGAAVIREE